ncbi:MAG TPA: hypothetical protein VEI73_16545 [Candidatus Acidoferrum sp.]|nr:hypothetical protein [Candidatus Acidoferrum sp.]
MHRRFVWILALILGNSLSVFAQQITTQAPSSPANPEPHAERPPAGHQQPGSNPQAPLTNADVIKMVKGGVPESAIVSSIQSGPTKFDLSATALTGLRKAGVSEKIIEAMRASGNVAQGTQPGPPKTVKPSPGQTKAAVAKLKARPGRLSPMISNPQAAQADAPLVAVLEQQKQGVQSGKIMSATGDPAGGSSTPPGTPGGSQNPNPNNPAGGGTNPNPSNPNPNNPSGGQNPAGGSPRAAGSSSKPATSSARVATLAPNAIPTPQNSGTSLASMATMKNTSIDACNLPNLPPAIKGLNSQGYYGQAVFSQDPKYNPFWVIGCHFGNTQGRAYLNTASGQKLTDLQITSWSDTLVKVTMDPNLIDVFDQDVTLVIVPASGQQGQKSGFKFFAMRKEILLRDIPKSEVTLAKITDTGGMGVAGYYSSPYQGLGYSSALQSGRGTAPNYVEAANLEMEPNSDKGMTAGADRNARYRFGSGTDEYDFSKLKPGFGVSRFQIDERNLEICFPGVAFDLGIDDETIYNDGSWNAQFYLNENKIRVTFAEAHCHFNKDGSDSSNSTYALNVWVIGPAMRPQASPWQAGLK